MYVHLPEICRNLTALVSIPWQSNSDKIPQYLLRDQEGMTAMSRQTKSECTTIAAAKKEIDCLAVLTCVLDGDNNIAIHWELSLIASLLTGERNYSIWKKGSWGERKVLLHRYCNIREDLLFISAPCAEWIHNLISYLIIIPWLMQSTPVFILSNMPNVLNVKLQF